MIIKALLFSVFAFVLLIAISFMVAALVKLIAVIVHRDGNKTEKKEATS
jgi:hypothetical protein